MNLTRLSLLLLFVSVAAPARAIDLATELDILLEWVSGHFDNEQQVKTGENRLRREPLDLDRAPDLLYPVFARVEAPQIGQHVVYLQWHIGSPDGPLQRQRIWSFEIDAALNAVLMDFFTLREPARWRDAHLQPATAMVELARADLLPYPPDCRLPFRRHIEVFIGEIPRGECNIVSQQTRTAMNIQARVVVSRHALWYDESGTRPDGSVVFKVPASGAYQFTRVCRPVSQC